MLELKVPWPMSAISETYDRTHNILELKMSYQMILSQQVKRYVIITSKNGNYELTDEFPNDVRLKKISKLHGIKVQCPVFFPE